MAMQNIESPSPAAESPLAHPIRERCPFTDSTCHTCLASTSGMALDPRRRSLYCCSESFDRCPLFLSKLLRGGRPIDYRRHIGSAPWSPCSK